MFNLVILPIILISILSGYLLEKAITAYKIKKTLKRLKDNSTEMSYKYHYKPKEEINDEKTIHFYIIDNTNEIKPPQPELENLEELLKNAIYNEDYEAAVKYRDQIKTLKNHKNK